MNVKSRFDECEIPWNRYNTWICTATRWETIAPYLTNSNCPLGKTTPDHELAAPGAPKTGISFVYNLIWSRSYEKLLSEILL